MRETLLLPDAELLAWGLEISGLNSLMQQKEKLLPNPAPMGTPIHPGQATWEDRALAPTASADSALSPTWRKNWYAFQDAGRMNTESHPVKPAH